MKILLLFFIGITLSFNGFSQKDDTALAKVFYILKHQQDTSKRDSIYTENMLLLVGKNASVFCSLDKIIQARSIEKDQNEQARNWTGTGSPRFKDLGGLRKASNQEIFQFQQEKKLIVKEYLINNYLYEKPLDDIKWVLEKETKVLDKIHCQKATAIYKGRLWIAWFASDIPFETGPWKLHGLPGLIIEACDSKKEVQFIFAGFERIKNPIDLTEN